MVPRGSDRPSTGGDLVNLFLTRSTARDHGGGHYLLRGLVQREDDIAITQLFDPAHALRGPDSGGASQALVLSRDTREVLALGLGDPELLVRALDRVGQVVPVLDLTLGRLHVVVDVREVEACEVVLDPLAHAPEEREHRLVLEAAECLQPEVPHPVGFLLDGRHLADDLLVQALLGLEDVVLLVAPSELVATEIEIRLCHSGLPHACAIGGRPNGATRAFPLSR